jgi:hypothetical protein
VVPRRPRAPATCLQHLRQRGARRGVPARTYADRLGTAKIGSASLSFKRIDDIDRDQLAAMLTQAHELTPPDGEARG